ncbi:MBL fold metallo-hydrolase [Bacillus kwashiorkori]|uniref:MBL fold metallo-hydrolase n=1 Tax=Bacillus kwashiorkori TaxID=1522318 RepID=UPI000781DC49|nr:MBL fold metallo-hydrolase [Bacillus kwashiorkori]
MLLKYFYDEKLAQASYMVGCQAKGEAVIVDPMRNIEPYLKVAEAEKMKIVGVLETHIHADYVSGARELGVRLGATLYVSDEGDENWKYKYVKDLPHQLVKDGDKIQLGNLTFEVVHTPGHTPESISFLLTDANADEPMGIFTGDFVFVGDIGRPDLLEEAAGLKGTAMSGAVQMYDSVERFKNLPDFLQVWPAHGAGSACGKALGAIPSSTIGYEKRFNWAMKFDNREEFVKALLEGQPEAPYYFAVMKRVNKEGPELLQNLPEVKSLTDMKAVADLVTAGEQVLDTRDSELFAKGHVQGTINIPFTQSFTNWAGWIVDYNKPLYLITEKEQLDEVLVALRSVGIDQVVGFIDAKALDGAENLVSYENMEPEKAEELIANNQVNVLDVRNQSEWEEGHIEDANHIMLGKLLRNIDKVPTEKPLVVMCQAGGRSAIATSILQAKGITNLYNLTGGYSRWIEESRAVTI